MNADKLLVIAKKMGLFDVVYKSFWEPPTIVYECGFYFEPHIDYEQLLKVMCHFRIWIDDKPDGSVFSAYHFDGNHKHVEERRPGPATPEGIVELVLELAYRMSI